MVRLVLEKYHCGCWNRVEGIAVKKESEWGSYSDLGERGQRG
jgi:hypothetical protein